jgi:hypothetical protein
MTRRGRAASSLGRSAWCGPSRRWRGRASSEGWRCERRAEWKCVTSVEKEVKRHASQRMGGERPTERASGWERPTPSYIITDIAYIRSTQHVCALHAWARVGPIIWQKCHRNHNRRGPHSSGTQWDEDFCSSSTVSSLTCHCAQAYTDACYMLLSYSIYA